MLKALFVFEIFRFVSWLFGYVEKWLDKKAKVNFNVYELHRQDTTNILPNISRSKYNQAMKFVQLIKDNMGNIHQYLSFNIFC